jgi:hypothetical protein
MPGRGEPSRMCISESGMDRSGHLGDRPAANPNGIGRYSILKRVALASKDCGGTSFGRNWRTGASFEAYVANSRSDVTNKPCQVD